MARELDLVRQQMEGGRNRILNKENEIKSAEKDRSELQRIISTYQQKLEDAPLNEQQYNALLREFNLAKQDYEDMSKRHDASETAQSLEEHKAGENLEMLDPASLPEQPAEPNRLAWAGIGTAGGLCLGIMLAAAQGNAEHVAEKSEGRSGLHQHAGAQQHSAAGECAAGPAQAAVGLAGMVERGDHRLYPDERLDVLSLFRGCNGGSPAALPGRKTYESSTRCIAPSRTERACSEESAAVLAPPEEIIAAPEAASANGRAARHERSAAGAEAQYPSRDAVRRAAGAFSARAGIAPAGSE